MEDGKWIFERRSWRMDFSILYFLNSNFYLLSSIIYRLTLRSLTYQHWAGVSPYTLPFGFAGTCVLDKQSLSNLLLRPARGGKGISQRLRPAFLPSSLNIFLPIALVYSTSPPVSVYGTVRYEFSLDCSRD